MPKPYHGDWRTFRVTLTELLLFLSGWFGSDGFGVGYPKAFCFTPVIGTYQDLWLLRLR